MVLIRLRHDKDYDASDGGHAKTDCHGGGYGNDHGDGGGYGESMANLMVLVMAMAMMIVMAVVIKARQRSQHCNLILCLSRRAKVTTLRLSIRSLTHGKCYSILIIM